MLFRSNSEIGEDDANRKKEDVQKKIDEINFGTIHKLLNYKINDIYFNYNKNNPEDTWTGRGKQPRWLVAELEKGAKLEDFLI